MVDFVLVFGFFQMESRMFIKKFVFLDAPSHLYTRLCPSVRRSVRRSVRLFVSPSVCHLLFTKVKRTHTRRILCRVSGLVFLSVRSFVSQFVGSFIFALLTQLGYMSRVNHSFFAVDGNLENREGSGWGKGCGRGWDEKEGGS